jgi:hypothetical protein
MYIMLVIEDKLHAGDKDQTRKNVYNEILKS